LSGGHLLVQNEDVIGKEKAEGHDVDPDERTARVKGNERPLPLSPTPIATPLCTSRMLLTILVAKATKMEISPSSKAKRRGETRVSRSTNERGVCFKIKNQYSRWAHLPNGPMYQVG